MYYISENFFLLSDQEVVVVGKILDGTPLGANNISLI